MQPKNKEKVWGGMGDSLVWYLLMATGVAVVTFGYWLRLQVARERSLRRRGLSWRKAQYYDSFIATLSAEQKRRFFSLDEGEQYKMYMEWSLREGQGVGGVGGLYG
ncbi:MAG: hypothetical protein KGZ66_00230 [Selenomonadales bacterium]|nr:hypothetical protein [Selenomonadales bacterium]